MYKITLFVYTNCGRNFTESEPIEISYYGNDAYHILNVCIAQLENLKEEI